MAKYSKSDAFQIVLQKMNTYNLTVIANWECQYPSAVAMQNHLSETANEIL